MFFLLQKQGNCYLEKFPFASQILNGYIFCDDCLVLNGRHSTRPSCKEGSLKFQHGEIQDGWGMNICLSVV